jgi:hypothetical protein
MNLKKVTDLADEIFEEYSVLDGDDFNEKECFKMAIEIMRIQIEDDRNEIIKQAFGLSLCQPSFLEGIAMGLGMPHNSVPTSISGISDSIQMLSEAIESLKK